MVYIHSHAPLIRLRRMDQSVRLQTLKERTKASNYRLCMLCLSPTDGASRLQSQTNLLLHTTYQQTFTDEHGYVGSP